MLLIGLLVVCVNKLVKQKQSGSQNTTAIHPCHSTSDCDELKIMINGYGGPSKTLSRAISIQDNILSRFLFDWKQHLKPLTWTQRLIIVLDVARGVEYLHGLAPQSFIHRDLKPDNILVGDDMSAKVADIGLVRPVPNMDDSLVTRLGELLDILHLNTQGTRHDTTRGRCPLGAMVPTNAGR
ncbi:hypothetical protein L1987_69057 [Smallanthus sonchifolius]|uniref:Uncharacterized protein n=1 Tax=Smallanthus sonchifolius TaxID=185202 RepID=A0ACB9B4N4_9ASTR|nr:hypothetical protein L1987_69057 [Smallanthus sonchifolius]